MERCQFKVLFILSVFICANFGMFNVATAQASTNDWHNQDSGIWVDAMPKARLYDSAYDNGWTHRNGMIRYSGNWPSSIGFQIDPVKDYEIEIEFSIDRPDSRLMMILPTGYRYATINYISSKHDRTLDRKGPIEGKGSIDEVMGIKPNTFNHLVLQATFDRKNITITGTLNGEKRTYYSGPSNKIIPGARYSDNMTAGIMMVNGRLQVRSARMRGINGYALRVHNLNTGPKISSRPLTEKELSDVSARSDLYTPPNMAKPWFDAASLNFPLDVKDLPAKLCDYVAYELPYTHEDDFVIASHMLGIALHIDPQFEKARLLNSQLSRGMRLTSPDELLPKPEQSLIKTLRDRDSRLGSPFYPSSKYFSCLINRLVLELIPEDDRAALALSSLEEEGYHANWDGIGNTFQGGLIFNADHIKFDYDDWALRTLNSKAQKWTTENISKSRHVKSYDTLYLYPAERFSRNYLMANKWVLDGDFEISAEILGAEAFGLVGINGVEDRHILASGKSKDWHHYSISRYGKNLKFKLDGREYKFKKVDLEDDAPAHFAILVPRTDSCTIRYFQISSPPGALTQMAQQHQDKTLRLEGYKELDAHSLDFDVSNLKLTLTQREHISNLLAGYVSYHLSFRAEKDLHTASLFLGLAKAFSPNNKAAVVANAQMKQGIKPQNLGTKEYTESDYFNEITRFVKQLRASKSPANNQAGLCLIEAILEINPGNTDAIYERELLLEEKPDEMPEVVVVNQTKEAIDSITTMNSRQWEDRIKTSGVAPGMVFRRQSSLKGMVVGTLGNGEYIGFTSDLILTVNEPDRNQQEAQIKILGDIGSQMEIALHEAVRSTKVYYSPWENANYHFSFGNKYGSKDGGSAGGAFAVLFHSVFEGFDIDSEVAVTGDISVDGKIRPVGAVGAKIRGARLDGCKIVGIPSVNQQSVADMILIDGYLEAANIQIFAVETVDDMVSLVRRDRDDALIESIEEYALFQDILKEQNKAYLTSQEGISSLKKVIKFAPNHLSAQYLLMLAENRHPSRLTLQGTLQEAFIAISPVQSYLWNNHHRNRIKLSRTDVRAMHKRLGKLTVLGHRDTIRLIRSLASFVTAYDRYSQNKISGNAYASKRNATLKVVQELVTDRTKMEKLMREGR